MIPAKVLFIDEDDLSRRSLVFNLENAGYEVHAAANLEDALATARRDRPDLVLLDISIEKMNGLETMHYFKDEIGVSVILFTSRCGELDEVLGLEMGADDCINKPIDQDVLFARIKAVLRRAQAALSIPRRAIPLQVGDLLIDPASHTVTIGGGSVELPPREFDLLHTLALEPEKVLSTDDLLARVWGAEYLGEPQVVYVHINWLRKKIEENPLKPARIVTVRGVGYKLKAHADGFA